MFPTPRAGLLVQQKDAVVGAPTQRWSSSSIDNLVSAAAAAAAGEDRQLVDTATRLSVEKTTAPPVVAATIIGTSNPVLVERKDLPYFYRPDSFNTNHDDLFLHGTSGRGSTNAWRPHSSVTVPQGRNSHPFTATHGEARRRASAHSSSLPPPPTVVGAAAPLAQVQTRAVSKPQQPRINENNPENATTTTYDMNAATIKTLSPCQPQELQTSAVSVKQTNAVSASESSTPSPSNAAGSTAGTGSKRGAKHTAFPQSEWYRLCAAYVQQQAATVDDNKGSPSQTAFLNSQTLVPEISAKHAVSFSRNLQKYKAGTLLNTPSVKRIKTRKFVDIEQQVLAYIESQQADDPNDDDNAGGKFVDLTWEGLQRKCRTWAAEKGYHDFKASAGWLAKVLERQDQGGDPVPPPPPPAVAVVNSGKTRKRSSDSNTQNREERRLQTEEQAWKKSNVRVTQLLNDTGAYDMLHHNHPGHQDNNNHPNNKHNSDHHGIPCTSCDLLLDRCRQLEAALTTQQQQLKQAWKARKAQHQEICKLKGVIKATLSID